MLPKFRLINEIRHVIKPRSSAEQFCWSGNHTTTTCFYRQTRKTWQDQENSHDVLCERHPQQQPRQFSNQQLPRWPRCNPWVTHTFFSAKPACSRFLTSIWTTSILITYHEHQTLRALQLQVIWQLCQPNDKISKFSILILNEFELVNFRNSP